MALTDEIREALLRQQDTAYRALQLKTIPTLPPETVIGVRTPALRRMAKELRARADVGCFLENLPHALFEENQLHAFLLSEIRDLPACLEALNRFLPYVDNWATCDQMSPKVFRRCREGLADQAEEWIASGETYTVRFGVKVLMDHFLEEDYRPAYPALVAGIRSEEYYVNMMVAWYFATALARRYGEILPLLEEGRLAPRTHNMAIRKAIESWQITPEQKAYLRTLRVESGRRKAHS